MIRALNFTIMMATLLAVSAQGAEPSYLPGGEEVKKAFEARRGKTELSKLAAIKQQNRNE